MARGEDNAPRPWQFAHIGLEFAGAAVVMALIGWWLDARFGTEPWLAVIGAAIGMTGGMYLFIKAALRANRSSAPRPSPNSPTPHPPRADVAPPAADPVPPVSHDAPDSHQP